MYPIIIGGNYYFGSLASAQAFAKRHGSSVVQSSPGPDGLWRVILTGDNIICGYYYFVR